MIKKMILITLIIYLIRCSSSLQMLPEPVENKNLIIGSITLDVDGYADNFLTVQNHIEVAVIGRFEENGRSKNFVQWTGTDDQGYFYIANVPDGEYAIKGFRLQLMGIGELWIANELNDPQHNYFELQPEEIINLSGELFDTKPHQRIINFKHNVFKLYQNRIVDFKRYDRLRDLKLSSGEIATSPPVSIYFIEKYEGSGWVDYLNLQ